MEGSGAGHLFQLDEDDIFNNDSFLEELEVVEKVERDVTSYQQKPSPREPQQSIFSKSNDAAPSIPRTATSVIPQAKTPIGGQGRRFSFKSKTSPEIPLPPDFGNNILQRNSSYSIGEKIGISGNQNSGLVQSNVGHGGNTTKSRKDVVTVESSAKSNNHPPENMAKIPSPLANVRQLNRNQSRPDAGTSNKGSEVHKHSLDDVLDTSLEDFRKPPSVVVSHKTKSVGMLRPVASTAQSSSLQVPRQEVAGGIASTLGTPGQRVGGVQKLSMRSPPQGSHHSHQKDSLRTTLKPPTTPSSKVNSLSHNRYNTHSATMNTPTCTSGSNFGGRQKGPPVQQRNQNATQSPDARSGYTCNTSPESNQRGGASSSVRTPQTRAGASSYDQTPPPSLHHDQRYGTPTANRNTTPGNPVRTPNVRGRGMQQHTQYQHMPTMGHHTPGRGHAQQHHTPRAGHAQQHHTPRMGHAQQQYTPRMGNVQQQYTPRMGHPQQQNTPRFGHPTVGQAQRQHPQMNRPHPNHRQSTPGQPARPVLTPRVAQLCKGSGPSPGAGAVHGGARKFPGPAGMLPKLSPSQKLKDAAAALKKKVEEEVLSQDVEESSEEVADVGDFEHGAWYRMKTELGIKDRDPNSILQQNNIALVIRKASLKQLTKNKVSHLCVMIKTISLNSSDASVSLCDPSGEMHGTVHRRLIEEYQGDLRPGSVLVLRQVGVLSPSQRNHYLNITPSNLIRVFAGESTSRLGSQKTPKRSRKRSGKTPSRRKHSSGKASPESRAEPSALDESPGARRRCADDEGLGLGDAPVTMDTDNYIEDDDAGIWEEMLDDDEEDLLMQDSQVGEQNTSSKLNSGEEEEIADRNAMHPQNSLARQPSSNSSVTTISSSTSSSGMLPLATKRFHPVPSKPTPSTLSNLEEMKRPCLRDISGLGSNAGGGNQMSGSTKVQKPVLNSCREEIIDDLLDGLEDELFDDF